MKQTKKSLLFSGLALVLSVSMLIGSTFAWFTDSVTSFANKIQSGTLKVDLELLDKKTGEWNSLKATQAPIFDYDKWEPGYVDTKILKIENEGNLALKWVAKFYSEKQLSILADVIDVYVLPSNTELAYPTDRSLAGYTHVGTLSDFINSIEETTNGSLEAKQSAYLGIALKMQETAGNEYQTLSLGGAFDIRVFATQHTSESDSFGNQYDKNSLFEDFVDKSILTSQGKYLNDGADSVNFSIYHKGVKIVAASVPASAIANKDKPVTITIRAIDSYIEAGENTQSFAYDIDVTNLKSNLKGDQLVTVVIAAPKGLASIKAYHKNELLTDAVYDEVEGTITFKTASFSPFEFTTETYEVSTLKDLRDLLKDNTKNTGAYVKLKNDIIINLNENVINNKESDRDADHAYLSNNIPKYYNAVNIVSQNVAIDLNGHSITVFCGQGYNDNDDVGALFFVGENGSLNICDTVGGGFIKMESSIYAVWAPYASPSYVDIYSGAFIGDSYAGDPVGTSTDPGSFDGTMANENSNRALIYAGFGGNINVYGGYFLYNNTPNDIKNRNNGAFNAKDFYNGATPLITIHEGVMLIDKAYRQDPTYTSTPNGDFDNFSIKLDGESNVEGVESLYRIAEVKLEKPVKFDGKEYSTWYKVTRNYKNKITFRDAADEELDDIYIWDKDGEVKFTDATTSKDYNARSQLIGDYKTYFGGWVTAAAKPISTITTDDYKDYVLYPSLTNRFTVRWLDEDGNVHFSTETTEKKYSELKEKPSTNPASKNDNMKFDHWEVREVGTNGKITYTAISENYSITKDITLYPYYVYGGGLGLTPHDEDGDGRPEYYTVEAVGGLNGILTIPGDVNDIPVTTITDLSSDLVNGLFGGGINTIIIEEGVKEIGSKAFAGTADLKNVTIPKSVEKIGKNAFANDDWIVGGLGSLTKQITITYAGTKEDWNKIEKANGWDNNTRKITVNCTDGTLTY